MACKPGYFNGWGDCASLMEKMEGGILQEKGATAWTAATSVASASWQTVLADDDSTVRNALALPVLSFENTTDDVEVITSPLGKSSIGGKPIPKGVIYLDASVCDYKTLHDLEGKWFEFIPFFQGGSHWMTGSSDAVITYKGFRCKIDTRAGMPPEDPNQSYPLYIFFNSYSEFENVSLFSDYDWSYDDLLNFVPAGLDVKVTTAMSSGMTVFLVTKRGSGDFMTGLDQVGDWEIMKSNAEPVVATTVVTENGQGSYDVTIKEDSGGTPANIPGTEYAIVMCHDDDATNLTYVSHQIKVWGG